MLGRNSWACDHSESIKAAVDYKAAWSIGLELTEIFGMAPTGLVDIDRGIEGAGFPTTLNAYVGATLVSATLLLTQHPINL